MLDESNHTTFWKGKTMETEVRGERKMKRWSRKDF